MLEIVICEDKTTQRDFVKNLAIAYCTKHGLEANVLLATADPYEVLNVGTSRSDATLYFLDIDLGTDINGLALAQRIREKALPDDKVFIVFLTTHTEMSLLTFKYKVEALDFIPKDDVEELKRRICECIRTAAKRSAGMAPKTIEINVNGLTQRMVLAEILMIETTPARRKLRLHTKNRSLEFSGEMKDMEELLDERFIRCHKSFLVNGDEIIAISKKDNQLTLSNHQVCPLSRSGKKYFQ